MIETLPLDELKKSTKTIYESVEVIAKRARQINSLRRSQMEMIDSMDDQTEENFDEINFDIEPQLYEKKPKPTRQAIQELLDGKLDIKYPEKV
jgi:DNA-directed RNA polymerase subunit K/omega